MGLRQDPVQAAARFAMAVRDAAMATGGLATTGSLRAEPSTPTAIPHRVRISLDMRHSELEALVALDRAARDAAEMSAQAENCTVGIEPLWSIDPIRFDEALVARAAELTSSSLTSGPLHDAAAVARAGIPSVMVFARTRGGVSHSREEDADEADLIVAIEAYGELVGELIA
jgi:N-carbamoyl-L-amino-acid hydrolase